MSPTSRSLKLLRSWGFSCDAVERFIAPIQRRRDFLGIGDIIGVHPLLGFVMIQSTSKSNVAARIAKAKRIAALAIWLKVGCAFEVHGWHKRGDRWQVRRVALSCDDLKAVEVTRHRRRRQRMKQTSLFD